ncbi:hypothetical protein Csa_005256 [Cucumis sativus]|uniref:Uncharacterized protein n=1 Tax=Cucumis sativus TaxID=3659 RepID=A0A0A0KB15_CUCSA|nr:hypothetical protein Csa_005256 [Cucumis sativus]
MVLAPPLKAIGRRMVRRSSSVHERNDGVFQKSNSEFIIIAGSKSAAHRLRISLTFVPRIPAASFTCVPRSCHSKTPQNFSFSTLRLFHFIGSAEGSHVDCYCYAYVLNDGFSLNFGLDLCESKRG